MYYKLDKANKITKDGHIMFLQDVISDLNRKKFLEGEIVSLKEVASNALQVVLDTEKECDHLSAHIERLREALEKLMVNVSYKYGYKKETQDANSVFNETPSQSLDNIKADAIREMLDIMDAVLHYESKPFIEDYILQLRRELVR